MVYNIPKACNRSTADYLISSPLPVRVSLSALFRVTVTVAVWLIHGESRRNSDVLDGLYLVKILMSLHAEQ